MGQPTLVSGVSAVTEVVADCVSGVLVPQQNPVAFVATLNWPLDAALRAWAASSGFRPHSAFYCGGTYHAKLR